MLLLLQATLSHGRSGRDTAHQDGRGVTTGTVILIALFAGLAIAAGTIIVARTKNPNYTGESAGESDSTHWNPLDRV